MALSKITVTFVSIPNTGTILRIENDLSGTTISEAFDDIRYSNGVTLIGATIDDCAANYASALELDYNTTNLYTITVLDNVVTIEAVQDGVTFSETFNSTLGAVTTVPGNEPATPELTIDTIAFSEADTDPCNNVKVTVTTSELATKVTSPLLIDPNVANPFSFDWVRDVLISIDCETATLNASESSQLPTILSVANTTLDIINTPTGAQITVTHESTFGLTLQYSLDDITYQSSNIFTGQPEASYTMYVKDQLGCKISIPFVVDVFTPDITVTSAFSYYAKEMSIRMKENVVWDSCSIYRTEENTLSCEEKVEKAFPYIHKLQTCDVITTQFLSNYTTLIANLIKEDGSKVNLPITKKSNLLDVKDKRDATYFNAGDDQVGVYFTTGDTYDYDTGLPDGTYALNGNLPNYGVVGNYIYLDVFATWFQIVNIDYDEDIKADILYINKTYTGVPSPVIASSIYNQKNYEVYEYDIDFSAYDGQELQVELLQNHADFGDFNYLSEKIHIRERWPDTFELIWYGVADTWVFYSTGIKNKARVLVETFQANNDSSVDIHKTDITTFLIDSENYETMDLVLTELTTAIKRQLTRASQHKEFYIDKDQYVINSSPETTPVPFTNFYTLNLSLTKAGKVFNSEWNGDGNTISEEAVGLLQDNNNYIKV